MQCSMWGRRAEGVVCSVACGEGGLKELCAHKRCDVSSFGESTV